MAQEAKTITSENGQSKGMFTSENSALVLIDYQPEMIQSFFQARAAAAQIVRNETIGAREAVRQHPELAGTYLNVRAAELASKALRDPGDQRRFVTQVRDALADNIERGEPLLPVRLRDRGPPAQVRTHEPHADRVP